MAVAVARARWRGLRSGGAGKERHVHVLVHGPRHEPRHGRSHELELDRDRDRCAVPFDQHGAVKGEPEHGESVQPAVDLDQCFGHKVDEAEEERVDGAEARSERRRRLRGGAGGRVA